MAPRGDIRLFALGFCLVMMFILALVAAKYPVLAGKNRAGQGCTLQRVQQNPFECTLPGTISPNADQE